MVPNKRPLKFNLHLFGNNSHICPPGKKTNHKWDYRNVKYIPLPGTVTQLRYLSKCCFKFPSEVLDQYTIFLQIGPSSL